MNSITRPERAYSAPAASCAADLLFLLARSPEPLSVAEIARQLDLSKSLVFRVAHVLEGKRILTRVGGNRFWLGLGVLEIGGAYARQVPIGDASRQTLRDLAHELGATVTLAVLRGSEVFYVMSQEAPGAAIHVGFVGNRVPANCTALGKILLSELPPHEVRARFAGHYPALTPSSINSADALERELARVRERGYATTHGEAMAGRLAMAVAVESFIGLPERAALAVASNDSSFLDDPARILAALRDAGDRLTQLNQVQATFSGANL